MSDRHQGNPNERTTDRAAGQLGRDRNPADIPSQADLDPAVPIIVTKTVATYRIGPPSRPAISHDDGFLRLGRRPPTTADYLKLAKWKAVLEGGEALRPDLTDALAAYRHFLEGKGKDKTFSYDRYVMNDRSGRVTLENALLDFKAGVAQLWQHDSSRTSFGVTSSAISCGGASNVRFPYPATENWQKAIGGHHIWLSGNVRVAAESGRLPTGYITPRFTASMVLHAEDRYNFNPGDSDIVTGIPDSDNGIFEMTGLAHQFNHFAELTRHIEWEGTSLYTVPSDLQTTQRHRQPSGNRRVRNRI